MSLHDYDVTTKAERDARRDRAKKRTSGPRSSVDHLTDQERDLLETIRALGVDIRRGWLANDRTGTPWQHGRVAVVGSRSWSHSIDS